MDFIFFVLKDPVVVSYLAMLAILVLWLAVRNLRTWYWKIDRIVQILESIDAKLSVSENVAKYKK